MHGVSRWTAWEAISRPPPSPQTVMHRRHLPERRESRAIGEASQLTPPPSRRSLPPPPPPPPPWAKNSPSSRVTRPPRHPAVASRPRSLSSAADASFLCCDALTVSDEHMSRGGTCSGIRSWGEEIFKQGGGSPDVPGSVVFQSGCSSCASQTGLRKEIVLRTRTSGFYAPWVWPFWQRAPFHRAERQSPSSGFVLPCVPR